jgi:hypothetical protein
VPAVDVPVQALRHPRDWMSDYPKGRYWLVCYLGSQLEEADLSDIQRLKPTSKAAFACASQSTNLYE